MGWIITRCDIGRGAISTLKAVQQHQQSFSSSSSRRASGKRKTHYETLGIARTSTVQEINSAFFELSKVHHPDSASRERDASLFHGICEARGALLDPQSRKVYDAQLSAPEIPPDFANSRATETKMARERHELLEKLRRAEKHPKPSTSRPASRPSGQTVYSRDSGSKPRQPPAFQGSSGNAPGTSHPPKKKSAPTFDPSYFTKRSPAPPKPPIDVQPPVYKRPRIPPLFVPGVPPSRMDLLMYEKMQEHKPLSRKMFPRGNDPLDGLGWWEKGDGGLPRAMMREGISPEDGSKILNEAFRLMGLMIHPHPPERLERSPPETESFFLRLFKKIEID
ncbi:DnaJ-domain-containing protein [Athelia psychrophila]|uniref:DnaJ-domain-containing protein n=1 Tax=Athelia psychrophila TaxID=1759441 RepID=A0A166LZ74_9AGAM|nr:DnaJ-domain-containing protein [Fibularhizoctonia sp. CBS 109695]